MSAFDVKKLQSLKKNELIDIIKELKKEKDDLKADLLEKRSGMEERLETLERSHFLYLQYGRRESVEIVGIPDTIEQKDLEKEVVKVYNAANIKVHGMPLTQKDISACHRIGRKGKTIVRFVNRKHAIEGLINGRNLKGKTLYGSTPIFINNSFCREFSYYGYVIRKLKWNNKIDGYKIKNGVYQVKLLGNVNFVEVSHISDFSKMNLDISDYPRLNRTN